MLIENDFMNDDYSILIWIVGILLSAVSILGVAAKVLIGNKPLVKLLERYKRNTVFNESGFKVTENRVIVGKVNGVGVELLPKLKETGGMDFRLVIDLSEKPFYNNSRYLERALDKIKFSQENSHLVIAGWEPKVFNYEDFGKILTELQKLIDKIENKTSYSAW